jgi:Ca2+/Na+ antiporter
VLVEHVLNIVDLIGILTGISEVFLGVVVVAIGNSFAGMPYS